MFHLKLFQSHTPLVTVTNKVIFSPFCPNSFHEMIYFFHFFPFYFKYFLFTNTNPSSIYILNDKNHRAHDMTNDERVSTNKTSKILCTQTLVHNVVTLVIMTVNEYIIKWDGVITQVSHHFYDAYLIALAVVLV